MSYLIESKNPVMKEVYRLAKKVAPSSSTVLILGESGTGKEVLAKYIHFNSKRQGPFVAINCAAIPEELLEAELFGYEKGAFTGAIKTKPGKFEIANKGTLFLDEIGDLSAKLQAKLLRVLQERQVERLGGEHSIKVDVRIIAATNKDLEKEVKAGRFREDLFYRLNVIPIKLPPLRERKEDIPLLVNFFLQKVCEREGVQVKRLSEETLQRLLAYHWPGNVRELENLVERLVVLVDKEVIEPEDLSYPFGTSFTSEEDKLLKETLSLYTTISSNQNGITLPELTERGVDLNNLIKEIELFYLKKALEKTSGVKTKAAKLLNLNRTTFIEKLKKYNLA
ncbi:sigma-54-dependent Fis family transcriptional regulator [Thermodesulfobacterium sp. TA1]|uniref:sigma-54 interaction domain-containing protein n=1 Tax=Thermodesulfobacterium sp. TA1 TaxID=2234087 RepID=UPI001980A15D|nr:sigma-54 dependent transcriptional regulator [Thermodesulfobacterium sp. TA1]